MEKTLILNEGEYKKWHRAELSISSENSIPNMTSNTAPRGIASSSASFSGRYPYMAFSDVATSWFTQSSPPSGGHWIQYQFDDPVMIAQISLRPLQIRSNQSSIRNFQVLGSKNLTDFTEIFTGIMQNSVYTETFLLGNTEEYLAYRIRGDSYANSTEFGANRISMFEYIYENGFGEWQSVSSEIPTSQQFLSEGMDSSIRLLDRAVVDSEPLSMSIESGIIQGNNEKVFSKTIDLNKYLDIRSMKVEVK